MQPAMTTICAAPSYLDRFGVPQEPVDLRNHTCVQFTLSGYCDECAFRRGDRSVRFPSLAVTRSRPAWPSAMKFRHPTRAESPCASSVRA